MKKKLIIIILTIVTFFVLFLSISITNYLDKTKNVKGSKVFYFNYLRDNQYEHQYLENAELLYYNDSIGGIDSSGVLYFVYQFEEEPVTFLEKYFTKSKNEKFEEKVEELINTFYKKVYEETPPEFKINWEEDYYYGHDYDMYFDHPYLYFPNRKVFIMLKLES